MNEQLVEARQNGDKFVNIDTNHEETYALKQENIKLREFNEKLQNDILELKNAGPPKRTTIDPIELN